MIARQVGRSASYLFAALAALLIAGLAGALLLFGIGPLRLDFLKDDLARALAAEIPGYDVSIDAARLVWEGGSRGLAVQLDGVRFREADGRSAVSMPAMVVGLDRHALLTGALRPTEIAVEGASIAVHRTAEGRFSVRPAGQEGQSADWRDFLADLIAAGDSLRRVEVRRASLSVVDEASGGRLTMPRADLRLSRRDDGIGVELSGRLDFERRRTTVAASGVYRVDGESFLTIRFDALRPADVARQLSIMAPAPVGGMDLPLAGRIDLRLDAAGILQHAGYALEAGAGTIAWDALPGPAAIAGGRLAGSLDLSAGRVRIAALQLLLGDGATVEGAGEIVLADTGLGAEARLRLSGLTIEALAGYWPERFAPGARRWVTNNIETGLVTGAELILSAAPGELDASPPPADLLRLSFDFEGVRARYWAPLPPLEAGRGRASMDVQRFELTLDEGRSGGLTLSGGRVQIDGLSEKEQVAAIDVAVAGPAATALALLDRKPLRFASELGLAPDAVDGAAAVRARFSLPLRDGLALADITYQADAKLTRFAMPALFGEFPVSEGEIALAVDGDGIDAEGLIRLNGLPVSLSWRRDFEVAAEGDGTPVYADRYGLAASGEVADFRAIGLDLTGLMHGPVSTSVQLWVAEGGAMEAHGEADLAAATIESPVLHWRKPPAAPAQARFRLRVAPAGGIELDEIAVSAGSDLAVGSARLDAQGRPRQVVVSQLHLAGQDLSVRITWPDDGRPVAAALSGRVLDARPFLEDDAGTGTRSGLSADLTVDVDRLQIGDETALAAAKGELGLADGRLNRLQITGRLNGSAPIAARLAAVGDRRDLVLTSNDAGGVLRALAVLEDAEGGALRVSARLPDGDGPIKGRLVAGDVRVRRAPLLARVLSLGSIEGIRDAFAGEGITLRRVDLPFVLTPARMEIVDGRAVGPDIGLTLSGSLDRRQELLDFTGALAPTYALNRLLGEIPILGDILIGRKGEGVFAVTYHVAGPIDDPTVSVNPLSALAPGIFRRLVEGLMPPGATAGAEEGDAPDPLEQAYP